MKKEHDTLKENKATCNKLLYVIICKTSMQESNLKNVIKDKNCQKIWKKIK